MKELHERGSYALFPDRFLRCGRPNVHARSVCRSKKRLTNQEFMPSDYYTSYIPFITATPKEDFISVGNTNRQQIGGRKLLPISRIVLYIAETMKNRTIPFVLVWFCFMLFNLSDAWAQSAEARTAEGQTEIRPLQIGDTIPEELWNLPLQVVNHPEGKDTITLNDYRDKKLIILDFWATWCGACISMFPKMKELQNTYNQDLYVLPVSYESLEKIDGFSDRRKTANTATDDLFSVYKSVDLQKYFPHKMLPHCTSSN